MNAPDPRPPIADEQFDRLVDGALPPAERRALLRSLDASPDGWRRCALAFLEAQAWRAALGPVSKALAHDPDFDAPPPKARRVRPGVVPLLRFAALLFAGFIAGRLTVFPPSGAEPPTAVAMAPSPPPDLEAEPRSAPAADPPVPVAYVRFAGVDSPPGADSPAGLPVFAGPGLDDDWLRGQPTFVPEDVRRQWESRGYKIDSQRRLISLQLDDQGRYVSIPVDNVNLRYVGGPL